MPAVLFVKHLVECNCVLTQFKHVEPPKWHHFVVFSEIDETGAIIPSFSQCNNCGLIHKVIEVGTSTILQRDDLPSLTTIEDVKSGMPSALAAILSKHGCDLPTYQEVAFILEHKMWGQSAILTKEVLDGFVVGKYITILGDTLWKVNSFQEEIET
jgi:hypothetical protein